MIRSSGSSMRQRSVTSGQRAANRQPDLVIFATGEVRDTATFAASNQLPVGIDHVLVNGVEVVTGEAWNGAAAGADAAPGRAGIALKPTPVTSPTNCSS